MRLTKKQRRRIFGAILGVAYLSLFAWLVSPLWSSPGGAPSGKVPVRTVPRGQSLGIALEKPKALPESLPGSSTVVTVSTEEARVAEEATGFEPVSESGSEEASAVPEGGEASSGSSSGGEASQPPAEKQSVSSEG